MQFRYYYKPCDKKLNGLDRSITNATYFSPSSSVFLDFSVIATTQCCGLDPFQKSV